MPRTARFVPVDAVVHVVNRGNDRRRLFEEPSHYEDFLAIFDESLERHPIRVLAYALMPNHWHLLLWPSSSVTLSHFLHHLTTRHAARFRHHSGTVGHGHVYQSRYRSTLVRGEVQYVRTVRYVEANPLRANLVSRAEDWPWSSLLERLTAPRRIVPGPLPLPRSDEWASYVNHASVVDPG